MSLYSTQQGTLVIKENQVDFWEEGMVFGRQKNKRQKHSNDDPFQSYQISSGRSFDAVCSTHTRDYSFSLFRLSLKLKERNINFPPRAGFPMKSILPFPSVRFSRGEGAVQLRHRRQHPGPDGHVAQGQQARRRRPRRQGQGEEHSLQIG